MLSIWPDATRARAQHLDWYGKGHCGVRAISQSFSRVPLLMQVAEGSGVWTFATSKTLSRVPLSMQTIRSNESRSVASNLIKGCGV